MKPKTELTEEQKRAIEDTLWKACIYDNDKISPNSNHVTYPPVKNIPGFYSVLRLCIACGIDLELLSPYFKSRKFQSEEDIRLFLEITGCSTIEDRARNFQKQ